jgi:benzil reductase ((S)-benzoin forming)
MQTNLFIITGASMGLGRAISLALAKNHHHLILIARDRPHLMKLRLKCCSLGAEVDIYDLDLSKKSSFIELDRIFRRINWSKFSKKVLFNNASTISPINHLSEIEYEDIENLINLNLTSAIVSSKTFMNYCKKYDSTDSTIVNISSGVSLKPIEGWGLYCISKSAINMLSAMIVADSHNWINPIKSFAVNPGPLDTNMQKVIRESNSEQSPLIEKFIDMFNQEKLLNPSKVANKIIKLLNSDSFPNGEYVDLK